MNRSARPRAKLPALLLFTAVLAGCVTSKIDVLRVEPNPCAERLHEISGRILAFYAASRRLPASLDELRAARAPGDGTPLVCPVSGKSYLYNPEGLALPDRQNRLILYDATPAHWNGRWGIAIGKITPGLPLQTRVVWVEEAVIEGAAADPATR